MSEDVESAASFAIALCAHPNCDGGEYGLGVCCEVLAGAIEARDRLIAAARDEAWRKAYSGPGAGPMMGPQSPEELPGFLEGRDSVTRELERERCVQALRERVELFREDLRNHDEGSFGWQHTATCLNQNEICLEAIEELPDPEPEP